MDKAVSVVFGVETLLRTHISNLNSVERLESYGVSDGHQKCVKAIIFSFDYELSKESSVGAMNTQISNPPLGR
jgi:hypothetical protein